VKFPDLMCIPPFSSLYCTKFETETASEGEFFVSLLQEVSAKNAINSKILGFIFQRKEKSAIFANL